MICIDIKLKNKDELWDLMQGIIPEKFLNHWLTVDEIKTFRKEIKFKNDGKLSFDKIMDLIEQNGYNVQRIKESVNIENEITSVRISE